MNNIDLQFDGIDHAFPMIFVKGTGSQHYLFGEDSQSKEISIKDFYISQFTVTQKLFEQVMGLNPSNNKGANIPVETVSYADLLMKDGFLEKINSIKVKDGIENSSTMKFRLPTESEWEFAAKGGINWTDRFIFSGSNDIDEVAWYKYNSLDHSEPVGKKKPNQLGIFDMSGNIWEWCQDFYHENINETPNDGSPCRKESSEHVLRGGCFHNWAIHCTSIKRYAIVPDHKDPCIGFRLVLS